MTRRSPFLNSVSPKRSKNSEIEQPAARSISSSASTNGRSRRCASRRPMALLPAPIRPTSATVRGNERGEVVFMAGMRPWMSLIPPLVSSDPLPGGSPAIAAGIGDQVGCPRRAAVPFPQPFPRAHAQAWAGDRGRGRRRADCGPHDPGRDRAAPGDAAFRSAGHQGMTLKGRLFLSASLIVLAAPVGAQTAQFENQPSGFLTVPTGGMAPDGWNGTSLATAKRLVAALPAAPHSRALRDLQFKVLVSPPFL